MGKFGNTFGSKSVSAGHARKVWREVKDQYPVGGVVSNLSDWLTSGKGKIPAGTPCKWEDNSTNGKVVTCYTDAQVKTASQSSEAASNLASLGINGYTLYDILIEDGDTVGTATVVYAGEIYEWMLNSDTAAALKGLATTPQIVFVS